MQRLLVANWKMNTSYHEAIDLVDYYKSHLKKSDKVKIIVCAPSIWLESLSRKLDNSHIELGGQNIHYLEYGAVTGEVSAPMMKKFAKYVIIGHSERKKFFAETNEGIRLKVKMALKHGLHPIVCFGEVTKVEGIDHTLAMIYQAVKGLSNNDLKKIIFAYEPIWAIGTGKVATAGHARDMIESARERLSVIYPRELVQKIKFLYGGSVHSKNIRSFLDEMTINGFLVGGASIEAKSFNKIYSIMQIYE